MKIEINSMNLLWGMSHISDYPSIFDPALRKIRSNFIQPSGVHISCDPISNLRHTALSDIDSVVRIIPPSG